MSDPARTHPLLAEVDRHSTREIITDHFALRTFGHNPSWVKAVDYDALQQQVAALTQQNEELRIRIRELRTMGTGTDNLTAPAARE